MAVNFEQVRQNIIKVARAEVGYKEKPRNITKYWEDMYKPFQGSPWCAAWTGWVWIKGGGIDVRPLLGLEYYVPGLRNWARSIGAWKTSGQKNGDMVVYKTSKNRYFHVGLVWRDENSELYRAIEGNTSETNLGSQSDGGGVYIRYRNKSMIAGYIDFEKVCNYYKLTPTILGNKIPNRPETSSLVMEVWESSPTIKSFTREKTKTLQTKLVKVGHSVGSHGVDGSYKKDTVNAVKNFQKKHGLAVDGVAGPKTLAKLDEVINSVVKPVISKPKAPAFPLPKGFVYGDISGPKTYVSGRTENSNVPHDVVSQNGRFYSKGLKDWQQQMKNRGWKITPDGRFGDQTARVALQFKKNYRIGNDSRIGPVTWKAAWEQEPK